MAFFQYKLQFIQFLKRGQMDKQEPLFLLNKPKWNWVKIDSQLKTKIDGKVQKIPLKPSLVIEARNGDNELCQFRPRVIIDTQKSLQYENQVGWNWHKSSNLPFITVKFQIRSEASENVIAVPQGLQAQIFAVKVIVNTLERDQIAYLEDVGIRGKSKIDLKQGCGLFSGIRFLSTSYNNEGVKFYLLIVIKNKVEEVPFDSIVCSFMSPPIFVDSRKSARDYQQKKFMSFVELFQPELFIKDFTKRETKSKSDMEIKINNNFQGLFNYLTAPNIRHKVKHPLFLSVKFSNVFKILYNTKHQYFQKKANTTADLIRKLQKKLIKEIGGEKKSKKVETDHNKPFAILLSTPSSNHKKNKIHDCLEYLDCRAISLTQYQYHLTPDFKDISEKNDIVDSYTEIYQQLQKISTREINARKNREEEQAVQSACKEQLLESNDDDDQEDQILGQQPVKHQVKMEENHLPQNIQSRISSLVPLGQIGHPMISHMLSSQDNFMIPPHPNSMYPDNNFLSNSFHAQMMPKKSYSYMEISKPKSSNSDQIVSEGEGAEKKQKKQNNYHSDTQKPMIGRIGRQSKHKRIKMEEIMNEQAQMRKMRIIDQNNQPTPIKVLNSPPKNKTNDEANVIGSAFVIPEEEAIILQNQVIAQNQMMAQNQIMIHNQILAHNQPMPQNQSQKIEQIFGQSNFIEGQGRNQPNKIAMGAPQINQLNPLLAHMANQHMISQMEKAHQIYNEQEQKQNDKMQEFKNSTRMKQQQQRQAIKNEMLAHLDIQNNYLRDMIISNEVLKGRITTLFQMGKSSVHSQYHNNTSYGLSNNMKDNEGPKTYENPFFNVNHPIQRHIEEQHQAHLVQMAQNFQEQMNQMHQGGENNNFAKDTRKKDNRPQNANGNQP